MNITEILVDSPDYAKDIKLNYSKVLNENILEKKLLYGIILISSLATKVDVLKEAALNEVKEYIDDDYINDIYGAYSLMAMNSIYYRFTHLATEFDYASMPANLRMQFMTKHKLKSTDFEMLCLAVAAIIGCGKCINAHEINLRKNNISSQNIQTAVRISSIMHAIASIIKVSA